MGAPVHGTRGGARFGRSKPSTSNGNNDLSIDTASHGIPKARGSPGSIPPEVLDVLNSWLHKLAVSDWKARLSAIDGLLEFVKRNVDVCRAKMVQVMDAMEPRL